MEYPLVNFAGISVLPQFQDIQLQLKSARLYKYTLPFKQPLVLKHITLNHREGLILILENDQGQTGISEISPLPGFSRETLETALLNTTMILDNILTSDTFKPSSDPDEAHGWEENPVNSVALFGVEMAILSLLANMNAVLPGDIILGDTSARVPINGLIGGSLSDWVPEAEKAIQAGYNTLKIKVGRINSVLEARGILEIRKSIGPDIKLRLDANRSWDIPTAVEFGKIVESSDIEYIEEPLKEVIDLPRFFDDCGVPFAFDETMYHIVDPSISFDSYTGLKALVLKPTLIASTSKLIALVNQAHEKGVSAVISSSYESDVGLSILAQLAGSISGESLAVGLDTRSAFTAGTALLPTNIESGWMSTKSLTTQDLDLSQCELVHES